MKSIILLAFLFGCGNKKDTTTSSETIENSESKTKVLKLSETQTTTGKSGSIEIKAYMPEKTSTSTDEKPDENSSQSSEGDKAEESSTNTGNSTQD